ncbi:MAG TPA: ABC transporter ATP-binding protein [Candidatus Avilachnospira avicola]|nr:ABC transporter ATP-binding protein [Candidatus Avilachnospira avicola]
MAEVMRMQDITKIYPNGFVANKDITFAVGEHEIHALVGENGAGKTTLMKILFGMEAPQEGKIFINGKEEKIANPLDAIAKGIGMVHQHFMLVPSLTVAENVTLGAEPMKNGLFDFDGAVKATQEIADKYNFNVDALQKVSDLSVGQMQKVEILKALYKGAKLLILDEPTAVLTPQETEELFEQLFKLRDSGVSIIFISHKLEEVMRICSKVTILRHGRCMGSMDIEGLNEAAISKLMVGRDVVLKIEKEAPTLGKPVVEISDLVKINSIGKNVLDHVSFTIREGEVVGIAGVEGNGQTELSEVLAGLSDFASGDIKLNGTSIKGKSVREIRDQGMAYIAEDRMVEGVAGDMSIKMNIVADRFTKPDFKKGMFMDAKKINEIADQYIKDFEILCDSKDQPVRMLSGGNIQKVVVAREFTSGANFILACQPTRGIDVGTAEMIRKTIVKKSREEGTATLLISADLNEVLECSDRLLVMRKGKIAAAFPKANEVSEETLGEYMLGVKEMTQEEMEGLL